MIYFKKNENGNLYLRLSLYFCHIDMLIGMGRGR